MPNDIQLFDEQPVGRFPTRPLSDARIASYRIMPWPDGTRVTTEVTMTPFREFPDFDVLIVRRSGDNTGEILKQSNIIASMERQPAPTLWLPKLDKGTPLLAVLQILGNGQVLQTVEVAFEVGGPIVKQDVSA